MKGDKTNAMHKIRDDKKDKLKMPACNEHIGKIAAAIPHERQCDFGSYYPARTFVKPLPRQYATTLGESGRQHSGQRHENKYITNELF